RTRLKTRQNHAVRFSFIPVVMKSPGLKTYRGPKRKEPLGVGSLPGYDVPETAVKQGRLISKVNFRLAGWIAERHTKGTGFYRTGLFSSIKKPPDRRQTMEHLRYPNESTEYRAARNALLNDEIALRAQIEAVAAKRRALPPGGKVSEDYVFERIGKNAAS